MMRTSSKSNHRHSVGTVSIQYAPGSANARIQEPAPLKTELMAGLMRCMSKLIGPRSDVQLLDLGCGLGTFTISLAKNLGYRTTGADCSDEMLDFARKRQNADLVQWDRQDATALRYDNASFDVVFMSNLLDLVKRPHDVVRECSRVLKPEGVLVYHYGALEDILSEPEHKFFPETIELDYLRTPARKQVESWFKEAALVDVTSERDTYRPWKNAQERLLTVEEKSNVVLQMIDFNAYNEGLSRMRAYCAANPMDPWLRQMSVTTTYGRKTAR